MDGRGRFLDNIFIERLWRSLKYECVYLHAFSGGHATRMGIGHWIDFYNNRRPHAAHGGATPAGVYLDRLSVSAPGLRRPSSRQSWRRDESDDKPDQKARTVA